MPDDFAVSVTPSLADVDAQLNSFSDSLTADLSDFWPIIGENLAGEAQARWPLQRRSGRLRQSLEWTGNRLGRGGIYEPKRDTLRFGTRQFYAGFSHFGTESQRTRPLLHVDPDAIQAGLTEWAHARIKAAGFTA